MSSPQLPSAYRTRAGEQSRPVAAVKPNCTALVWFPEIVYEVFYMQRRPGAEVTDVQVCTPASSWYVPLLMKETCEEKCGLRSCHMIVCTALFCPSTPLVCTIWYSHACSLALPRLVSLCLPFLWLGSAPLCPCPALPCPALLLLLLLLGFS